jgi:hypothetical protein
MVLKQNGRGTGVVRMKVIKGSFDQKPKTDELTVPMVFDAIVAKEDLENYDEAFCIIKSEDFIVVSTNMDTASLYFLLDQLKMSLITAGEYEL